MKNYLLWAIIMLAFCLNGFANDKVVLHKGDTIYGKVVENNNTYIRFIYEGEDVSLPIGKVAIKEIVYNSGRVEECSPKVVIEEYGDYEQVIVLREKEDVAGLNRIKEITAKSGGEFAISDKEGRYIAKTIKKLQRQAYKMGGCAVLITSQTGNSASFFKNPHSAMTAVVYSY